MKYHLNEQQNQITHWLDLSQVYGNSLKEASAIRLGRPLKSGETLQNGNGNGGKIGFVPKTPGGGGVSNFRYNPPIIWVLKSSIQTSLSSGKFVLRKVAFSVVTPESTKILI